MNQIDNLIQRVPWTVWHVSLFSSILPYSLYGRRNFYTHPTQTDHSLRDTGYRLRVTVNSFGSIFLK